MTTSDAPPAPPRKRRAVLVVSVVAILVLGAIAASLLLFTDGSSSDDTSTNPVPQTVASPDAVTFRDPQGAYRIDVDRSWAPPTSAGDRETWTTGTSGTGALDRVTIATRPADDLDLDQYLQLVIREAPKSVEDFTLREFRVVTPEPDEQAKLEHPRQLGVVAYEGRRGGRKLSYFLVVDVARGNAVVATLATDRARADRARAAVEPYLMTLRPA